jgi:hypothetical protein
VCCRWLVDEQRARRSARTIKHLRACEAVFGGVACVRGVDEGERKSVCVQARRRPSRVRSGPCRLQVNLVGCE